MRLRGRDAKRDAVKPVGAANEAAVLHARLLDGSQRAGIDHRRQHPARSWHAAHRIAARGLHQPPSLLAAAPARPVAHGSFHRKRSATLQPSDHRSSSRHHRRSSHTHKLLEQVSCDRARRRLVEHNRRRKRHARHRAQTRRELRRRQRVDARLHQRRLSSHRCAIRARQLAHHLQHGRLSTRTLL